MTTWQRQNQFIHNVLQNSSLSSPLQPTNHIGYGEAPVNIALSKYWGKRDTVLNLPINGSVSIALPSLGSQTQIKLIEAQSNIISLNQKNLGVEHPFHQRLSQFLMHFKPNPNTSFHVDTVNTVPTAAGLASSASGYAALVLALNELFEWKLPKQQLSLLARFGSGSASRSLFPGFAQWHAGNQDNGLDSFAESIDQIWPEFCIGLVRINTQQKSVSSTKGMQNTVNHCELYQAWPQKAERDKQTIIDTIIAKDFSTLGQTAENNALAMHATMIASWPPLLYWQAESVAAMHKVWQLREDGIEVYFTMDAGPNLKLILQEKDADTIASAFTENFELIKPFNESANIL
jgi:diphosphomevalonate decarboxylase